MLVHRRVTSSIKFASTHLHTWVERGTTVRVKCLAQDQKTMSPDRTQIRTSRSGGERAKQSTVLYYSRILLHLTLEVIYLHSFLRKALRGRAVRNIGIDIIVLKLSNRLCAYFLKKRSLLLCLFCKFFFRNLRELRHGVRVLKSLA